MAICRAGYQGVVALKRAQQDDSTGVNRQAKNDAGRVTIPARRFSAMPAASPRYLSDSAGNGDELYRHQILQRKCSPTPNINRITPSASSGTSWLIPAKPGVGRQNAR